MNFKIQMPYDFIYAPCMSIIVRECDGKGSGAVIGCVEVPLRDHSLGIYPDVAKAKEDEDMEGRKCGVCLVWCGVRDA